MNKLNKYSRLLASYIDFVILMNLIGIANLLIGVVEDRGSKLLLAIVLYVIIGFLYVFKDTFFGDASLGKHLLGLKLESTVKNPNPNSTPNLRLRNLFGCLVIFIYMIYVLSNDRFANIVLLIFAVFNLILFCFRPHKKLGDDLARVQVVEDPDNKIWENIDTWKKNAYVAIVTVLLSVPLIEVLKPIISTISRIGWSRPTGLMALEMVLRGGLSVLVFYLFYQIIVKFVDNALLKKLMVVCAFVSMLCSLTRDIYIVILF
ncbi:MAG: RDD family protein [Paludibacteraceae bacterium]|nr:RDD family protein [Paludibacteraceae bacterium]